MSRFIPPFADVGKGITPSDGAKYFFFESNTSTPKNTYSDEALTIANANPVISDSNGLFPDIWLEDGQYKVRLTDKDDIQKHPDADPVDGDSVTPAEINIRPIAYDTVSAAISDTLATLGEYFSVSEYATGTASGVLQFKWVAASTGTADGGAFIDHLSLSLQAQQNFPSSGVSIKSYGAAGDDIADDTAKIQAAIDYAAPLDIYILVNYGVYRVTSTLVCPQGTTIYGRSSIRNALPHLKFDVAVDDVMFDFQNTNCVLDSLYMTDEGFGVRSNTLIKGENTENLEDVDMRITRCHTDGFDKGILIRGRGLYVDYCTFSRSVVCFEIERLSNPTFGANPDQKDLTGMRAYTITNNRFHALGTGTIILNNATDKEKVRGIHFVGNYIDTPATILLGSARESLFASNTKIYGGTSIFDIQGSLIDTNITGNTFTGLNGGAPASSQDYHNNIMVSSGTVENVNFSDNIISQVREDVIRLSGTSTNININNNILSKVLTENKTGGTGPHYIVDFNTADSRCSVVGNKISQDTSLPLNDHIVSPSGTSVDLFLRGNFADQVGLSTTAFNKTWVPSLGNFVATYTTQDGQYQIDGNVVTCSVNILTSAVTVPDVSGFSLSLPITAPDQAASASVFLLSGETPMINTSVAIFGYGVSGGALTISGNSGPLTYTQIITGAGTLRIAFTYLLEI